MSIHINQEWLWTLVISGLNIILYVMYISVRAAPWFSMGIIFTFTISLLFLFTEGMLTHAATEFENRFWSLIAFLFSYISIFAIDSPIQYGVSHPMFGWCSVITFTFMAHNYHRHLMRVFLSKIPELRRVRSAESVHNIQEARQLLVELKELLYSIDLPWVSSTFLNMFLLWKVMLTERKIINILEAASADQLNFIIARLELSLLFYKIKDHRNAHQYNRTKLLQLLAVERIAELNCSSRALLLHGFQNLKLTAHPQCDQWVQNIIEKTKRDELSELKSLTDSKGDVNSMHKLVYWDMKNKDAKDKILKHIAREAAVQASHMKLNTKNAKVRGKFAWRKILSDVDDTLQCSGGAFPAGCDTSFPKKCIYPGVLAFYRELDLGTSGPDGWDSRNRIGNLVFLSARPHAYKDYAEAGLYDKFRTLQSTKGMHTSPSLLPGDIFSGGSFLFFKEMERISQKKYENFRDYLALYPEFECVFIGDNGQGDVRASELLVSSENGKYSQNLRRTYIHEVLPLELTYVQNQATRSRSNSNICYFYTYIDAALDAYKHGLIRLHGLRKVVEEAKVEFLEISMASWEKTEDASAIFEEEKRISEESFAMNNLRRHSSQGKHLKEKQIFNNNKLPSTVPLQARPNNSITNNNQVDERALIPVPLPSASATTVERVNKRSSVTRKCFKGTMISGWKRERRIMELNRAIDAVNKELTSRKSLGGVDRNGVAISNSLLIPMSRLKIPCRYPVGKVVLTEYGVGIVNRFRPQDGIYEVLVHWGGHGDFSCVSTCSFGARRDGLEITRSDHSNDINSTEFLTSIREDISLTNQTFCLSSRSSCTPCCVPGSYIRVYLTASNLSPTPTPVPQYMSDTPRALSTARSAIWHQVKGLLGGTDKRQGSKYNSSIATSRFNDLVNSGVPAAQSLASESMAPSIPSLEMSLILDSTAKSSGSSRAILSSHDGTLCLVYGIWRGVNDDSRHTTTYLRDHVGCLVWTPFGYGHILYVRRVERVSGRLHSSSRGGLNGEDMTIVRLHWGAICSLRRRCTVVIAGEIGNIPVGIGGYNIAAPYSSPPQPTASLLKSVGKSISNKDYIKNNDPSTAAVASYIKYSPKRNKAENVDEKSVDVDAEHINRNINYGQPEANFVTAPFQNDDRKQRSLSAGIELELLVEPNKVSAISSGDDCTVERKPRSYSETESNPNAYGTKYLPNWLRLPLFKNANYLSDPGGAMSSSEKVEINIDIPYIKSSDVSSDVEGLVSVVNVDNERDSCDSVTVGGQIASSSSNDLHDPNLDENADSLYF